MHYRIIDLPFQRRKNWVAIFWQESTDYEELIRVCTKYDNYWISPLHQPDSDCSKPHYHVVVGNNKSSFCPYSDRSKYNDIVNLTGATWSTQLNKGIAYPVDNLNRQLAYLVHLNHPERQQFPGGLSEIQTNNREKLDGIVKAESGFSCYEWDEEHKPVSFMDSLGIMSKEGFLTPSEACKLVTWYANHMDVFEGREEPVTSTQTHKGLVFTEVFE